MDLCTCRISSYHKIISSKKCITYILRMSDLFGVSNNNNNEDLHREKNKNHRYSCKIKCSKNWEMAEWMLPTPGSLPALGSHWTALDLPLPPCSAPQPQAALARAPLLPTSFWLTHLLPGTASTSPSRVCATAFLSQFSGFPPEITFSRLYKSSVFFMPEVSGMWKICQDYKIYSLSFVLCIALVCSN